MIRVILIATLLCFTMPFNIQAKEATDSNEEMIDLSDQINELIKKRAKNLKVISFIIVDGDLDGEALSDDILNNLRDYTRLKCVNNFAGTGIQIQTGNVDYSKYKSIDLAVGGISMTVIAYQEKSGNIGTCLIRFRLFDFDAEDPIKVITDKPKIVEGMLYRYFNNRSEIEEVSKSMIDSIVEYAATKIVKLRTDN